MMTSYVTMKEFYAIFIVVCLTVGIFYIGIQNSVKEAEFKEACIKAGGSVIYSDKHTTTFGGTNYTGPVCVDDSVVLGVMK